MCKCAQVKSEWECGNLYGAQNASRLAKNWDIAGGIIVVIVVFLSSGVSVLGAVIRVVFA